MSTLISHLRSLDRKERFAILREALGFDPKTPCLDDRFRQKLGRCIGVQVPERVFLAMDHHLDWIRLALHLTEDEQVQTERTFKNPGFKGFNENQEDIDLLVAFEGNGTDQGKTHLVLIEAKAYLPWANKQLKSKAKRLCGIFGDDGARHDAARPHFVLMTESRSKKIDKDTWPNWMTNGGNICWLEYSLPVRTEVTRCTDGGRPSKTGSHLRLDPVPRHAS